MLTDTAVSDYISLGACLENMSLKAVDLGLGSLIICDTQSIENELVELFGDEKLAALFVVGYADDSCPRHSKKPLTEIVRGIKTAETDNGKLDTLPEADISAEPFLFISYSHRDANIVISDIAELKKFGVRLWYDRSICSGEIWDKKALSVIDRPNCAGVLVYVSENAVRSESIAKELRSASRRFTDKSCIVSVHIGDKPMSAYGIPKSLESAFSVISDEKKYIPRTATPGIYNLMPIVAVAERLGAVSENGVYDGYSYDVCRDGVCIMGYNGCSQKVEIPSAVAGLPVVTIGNSALRGNTSVREVVVPFTVKRVEEGAFFGMTELENIFLPKTMSYIGVAAFRGCTKLKKVELPTGIEILSEALFRDCTALVECDVPETVIEFGEAVFRNCSSLCRVSMPTVRRMTEGGVYGCRELREVTMDPAIQGLEVQSFETCPYVS
ncbi:MAG: leucine-rich repeat protein, partial [Clostridia bacterium]|nr:leucine-rich repeat protein [Clostridia bacterium]